MLVAAGMKGWWDASSKHASVYPENKTGKCVCSLGLFCFSLIMLICLLYYAKKHFFHVVDNHPQSRMGVRSLNSGEKPWEEQIAGNFVLSLAEALTPPLPSCEGV
ncbi:hypothetical protein Hanom_Chr06g00523121 [Helianthus anomalus]